METVCEILQAIDSGRSIGTNQLLPVVYAELKQMAVAMMARETPGQTLQATALVHEAYLRLFKTSKDDKTGEIDTSDTPRFDGSSNLGWISRAHFFASAAEAMRRILIDAARRKKRQKRGGNHARVDLDPALLLIDSPPDELLDLDEALRRLEAKDKMKADVVKLRYFAGLTVEQTAVALKISEPTVKRHWSYARAWLRRETYKDE